MKKLRTMEENEKKEEKRGKKDLVKGGNEEKEWNYYVECRHVISFI